MNKRYIKVIILIVSIFFISGCVNVRKNSIEDITSYIINSTHRLHNTYNNGYKYYLPRNLEVSYKDDMNEIIKSRYYDYYLYVDLVSYYNKSDIEYKKDESLYYSSVIKTNKGIINVTKMNEEYLIHIEYNYAKIEVKVKKHNINDGISNALIILSSLEYNDEVIRAMMNDGVLSINERNVDVFKKTDVDKSNFLNVDEEYEEDEVDTDYIN